MGAGLREQGAWRSPATRKAMARVGWGGRARPPSLPPYRKGTACVQTTTIIGDRSRPEAVTRNAQHRHLHANGRPVCNDGTQCLNVGQGHRGTTTQGVDRRKIAEKVNHWKTVVDHSDHHEVRREPCPPGSRSFEEGVCPSTADWKKGERIGEAQNPGPWVWVNERRAERGSFGGRGRPPTYAEVVRQGPQLESNMKKGHAEKQLRMTRRRGRGPE